MEDNLSQAPSSQFNYSSPPKKSKKFLFIIIFFIILVGIVFTAQKLFFGAETEEKSPVITPTPTEFQFPTDTPMPTPTGEEEEPTISPTVAKPTVDPVDKSTGLDRSALSIEVQNGSGEVGAASKGSDILKSFGYKITATANADNFDYENAIIKVKSIKSNFLPLIKKDLGFSYTIGSTSADLSSDSAADALVIIGK